MSIQLLCHLRWHSKDEACESTEPRLQFGERCDCGALSSIIIWYAYHSIFPFSTVEKKQSVLEPKGCKEASDLLRYHLISAM